MSEYAPGHEHPLLIEAERLISTAPDSMTKANMICVAIEQGMPLGVETLMQSIAEISGHDERGPDVLSLYQQKTSVMQAGVKALASQKRFDDTGPLMHALKMTGASVYQESVTCLLGHGYAGLNDELLSVTAEEIMDGVRYNPDRLRYPATAHYDEMRSQVFALETYLEAVAHTGVDITESGSEYSRMLVAIAHMSVALDQDAWQQQRRTKVFGLAYAHGNHLESALQWKEKLTDHTLKATLCLEIAGKADDPAVYNAMLDEAEHLTAEIARCTGDCLNRHCDPKRDVREVSLMRWKLLAQENTAGAYAVKQSMGKPEMYFPKEQMEVYMEMYKNTGDEECRSYCLGLLNDSLYRPRPYLSKVIGTVAEADMKWGNVLASPLAADEPVPMIGWEVEKVYWGIDKYLKVSLGEDTSDVTYETKFDRGMPTDKDTELWKVFGMQTEYHDATAFGPLSSTFGDPEMIQADLERCQKQRDAAYVELALLLTDHGSHTAANYFLNKIDRSEDKIRGLVAIAYRSAT